MIQVLITDIWISKFQTSVFNLYSLEKSEFLFQQIWHRYYLIKENIFSQNYHWCSIKSLFTIGTFYMNHPQWSNFLKNIYVPKNRVL